MIVSRDQLRASLFGYLEDHSAHYQLPKDVLKQKEQLVSECAEAQIQAAVSAGLDVVVDDTNLHEAAFKRLIQRFPHCNFLHVVLSCTIEEAKVRNSTRARQVPPETIDHQFACLQKLQPHLSSLIRKRKPFFYNNPAFEKAVVVDMDGTLALLNGRNPYDSDNVRADTVNKPVLEAVLAMKAQGHSIVICTGRKAEALQGTVEWLQKANVPFSKLYIRNPSDSRPDYVVKEEMWKDIVRSFYIAAMFDDRDSVVRHARLAGFMVFQVNEGNF